MVRVRVNTEKLERAMNRSPRKLAEAIGTAFDQHGFEFEGYAKATLFDGRPGLIGRTGKLSRSIKHRVKRASRVSGVRLRVFAGNRFTPYARVQEEGGTITPTRARFLTIPLPDNLTAGGVPRYKSARALFADPSKDVFTLKSGDTGVIGLRKNGRILWLWKLARRVEIPPRFGFRRAFTSRRMQVDRVLKINAAIREALQ